MVLPIKYQTQLLEGLTYQLFICDLKSTWLGKQKQQKTKFTLNCPRLEPQTRHTANKENTHAMVTSQKNKL